MKFVKGQSANPGGKSATQQRLAKRIDGLSVKAIATLDRNMDCGVPAVEVAAAREVLARTLPIPKQSLAQLQAAAAGGAAAGFLAAIRAKAEAREAATPKIVDGRVIDISTPSSKGVKD